MAIQYNENIQIAAPNPLDKRYLSTRTLAGSQLPYSAVTEVNNMIPHSERYSGLTVNVGGAEYWYKDGVTDNSLVIKTSLKVGTVTGATNGLILSNSGTTISLGGNLTGNTSINGVGIYDLSISNINGFQVKTSGDTAVFGVDENGFLLSFSGGSVSFDDNGGLKYDTDYSSNFTKHSIVDVNYLTGNTTGFLKLNQGNISGQTVIGKQPIFSEGIILGSNPTLITGHTKGKAYYDDEYQTISINLNDGVNLQLGQEDLRYVYNASSTITIPNGAVVYSTGVYDGNGGITAAVATVGLAISTGATKAAVLGLATEDIPPLSYGFITYRGHINGLNTTTSHAYSGMTNGDYLFLSSEYPGEVTNIPPISPNLTVYLGRLIVKNQVNGKIYVQIFGSLKLNDLNDVSVPSPNVDEILKWNGVEWVNGTAGSISASAGVNFYNATPITNSRTAPFGINSSGIGNGIQVGSLSKTPITTGGTRYSTGQTVSDIRAITAWKYDNALNKTTIDAGIWKFGTYVAVDSAVGDTYVTRQIYQVSPITGNSITTSGASANSRYAVLSSGIFDGIYFSGSSNILNSSWLQTSTGIYQISGKTSNNRVIIIVPTGYVNQTNVSGSLWNKLFGATSSTIESIYPTFTSYEVSTAQPAFTIFESDRLGQMGFVSNLTSSRTVYAAFNGNTMASYFNTPLVTAHNDLPGLQGGSGNQRYHIDLNKYNVLQNTSGVNTNDETKASIESKLTGNILSHWHDIYTLNSSFSAHTGNTNIHFTQAQICIPQSQISGLTTTLAGKSNTGHTHSQYSLTGHTHSYTGSTITNKPIFVGSGGTTVTLVNNNQYRICSQNINYNVGYSCLINLSTSIGCCSLPYCTDSNNNTSLGIYNLTGVTQGCSNTVLGNYNLNKNTTGCYNIGIGLNNLMNNTSASCNIAIGFGSLSANTTGVRNLSIGYQALKSNISGNANIAFGNGALLNNINGCSNLAIGTSTLFCNISGNSNVSIGSASLICSKSGKNNTALGVLAGCALVSGSTNIFLGYRAGSNETGSGKLYIGTGNTTLIMGDLVQGTVILPKLYLRCTPTGTGNVLCWNNTTCEVERTCGSATWGSISGTISSQTDLINCLNTKSNTGHTHSYTGNTITNKPTFVGSGDTRVCTVNNQVRIYSNASGSAVFTENLYVSIASGKTFGKYVNGDTIPSSGKTITDVIKMAINEAIPPTVNVNASGSDVSFGQPSKTVNVSLSYTINTLNGHAVSAVLEWRRNNEGVWSSLPITTGSTSYFHTIDDSTHRFSATTINYRYTVTDNEGASNTAYSNVTPAAYAAPTMSPTYTGTVVAPETQTIRELGNISSTIAGTITSNRSLVNITRYVVERSVNGAAYTTIQDISVFGTSITISSYVDSSASGSATSIAYRLTVYDEYTTTVGSVYTITFRSMSYFGYNSNTTLTGAQIIALGNTASLATRARTVTNVTSGVGNYTYISYPLAYGDLTSIKLGGVEEVIGAWSKLTSVSVTNSYSQTVSYNIYRSNATNAYTNETLAIA